MTAHRSADERRGRVTVLGSINMDVVLRVETLPQAGETVLAESAARLPGGKGANQAIAAARAGADVRMIGTVGEDADGRALLDLLRGDGVDCEEVRTDRARATGVAHVTVDRAGENQIAVAPGANSATVIAATHRGGVLLAQLELPLPVLEAFLAQRAADTVTMLNAAPFHPAARPLFERADIIVVNEVELAGYAGSAASGDIVAHARGLLSRRGQRIVVTLGGRGSLTVGADGVLAAPAAPAHVVDTTGAGDCFCGFLAAGIAAGQPFAAAVELAHRAAAVAVGRLGAAASTPWRAELDQSPPAAG